jgi:D-inositol-3-phosphate glycosyltransferase
MRSVETNSDKPVLLAVSIYVPGYSFTRVFDSLLEKLSAYYAVHWLGIAYKGAVIKQNNYTLHPSNISGGDIYGAYGAAALAMELQATTVLLLNDFYLLRNYQLAWQPLKEQHTRLVAYVPVDGRITDVSIAEECFFLDEVVLYHNDALQDVKRAVDDFVQQQSLHGVSLPHFSYRYHGVDTSIFRRLSSPQQQTELKKQLFYVPDAADAVFILNGNRFNERKDIASTIDAFAKALPQFKKPAYLCLHTPNLDAEKRPSLESVIENSGCKKNILLNPLGENYISDEKLVQLYQACAIGVNTSFGEGWGMISFEHAACGAVQLVPAHTAPGEVWKDAGILIPLSSPVQLSTNPFLMYAVDADELSRQLVKLVNDDVYLEMTSANCYTHSQKDEFKWDSIAMKWHELL